MSKNKKPFPFEVCKECCEGGGTGGTVDQVQGDWNQSDETKVDHIKNRTHYSESVLLCDYTHTLDVENWDGSDYGGTFILDKELDVDKVRLYINGEYVPTTYVCDDIDMSYYFIVSSEEGDYIFNYDTRDNYISFPPWVTKGNNYKVYEETVHQLEEKYIPSSIARTEDVATRHSNALKGNVHGEIVSMTDVSPIEHTLEVKVSSATVTDFSVVTLSAYGKNLFNNDTSLVKNVTYQSADGNVYNTDGGYEIHLPAGIYTLSLVDKSLQGSEFFYTRVNDKNGNYIADCMRDKNGAVKQDAYIITNNVIHTPITYHINDGDVIYIFDAVGQGATAAKPKFERVDFQLEAGEKATEYEPYKAPITYPIKFGGTVKGVKSIYPCTTLMTDTSDVGIICEYNKDINKVIENLTNAIISLGGNV